MKKFSIYLLTCFLAFYTFTACQIDNYTDQNEDDWNLEDGEMVDDSGYSGTAKDYEEDCLALSQGEMQIPGRSQLSRFSMSPSLMAKLYNDQNPKQKITATIRSEKWKEKPHLSQCVTDGKFTIYVYSSVDVSYAYFSYSVEETQNGAWDYEDDINRLIAVFDNFMPTLYDENNKLSLEYLSKWIDVGSKEQDFKLTVLEILRKYMTTSFEIHDGIAYLGIGSSRFPIEDNLGLYF